MKTVNLSKESPSVNELLAMAREKSVLLVSDDGTTTNVLLAIRIYIVDTLARLTYQWKRGA
ncbi:MAG: hypothetical protein AUG08_01220 [Acidobacteria bacterium 13_1_20CM_2_55_15]|nr:MAG: hypothetical protein AUG08_01220 [Acidobacteria bacterium 13_1_20CM_2_55_15]